MSTPPQGQNPYYGYPGNGQPGQQPQPPQGPYGQQPGPYGQQPGPYAQQQPGPYVQPAPVRPRQPGAVKKYFTTIVAVLGLLGAGAYAVFGGKDEPRSAKVGDCVINKGSEFRPDVKVVKCSSSEAEFTVAQRHDGQAECDRTKYASYSETKGSDVKFTLCLKPIKGQ
jgi:hypothetical protein